MIGGRRERGLQRMRPERQAGARSFWKTLRAPEESGLDLEGIKKSEETGKQDPI